MKKIFLFLITIYQNFLSLAIRNLIGSPHACRFNPTCSEYAKIAIRDYGVLKGSYLALIRLLKCQPFYKQSLRSDELKQSLRSDELKETV